MRSDSPNGQDGRKRTKKPAISLTIQELLLRISENVLEGEGDQWSNASHFFAFTFSESQFLNSLSLSAQSLIECPDKWKRKARSAQGTVFKD